MVIDNETGWSDFGVIEPDPVLSRFRASLVAARSGRAPRHCDDRPRRARHTHQRRPHDEAVLGLVVEEVGGQPLAELIRDRVAGAGGARRHRSARRDALLPPAIGMACFAVQRRQRWIPRSSTATSYLTWNQATHSAVSTPTDLLDLLDVWATGELFTTDRAPAPDATHPNPCSMTTATPMSVIGVDVPFNGICPCTEVDGASSPPPSAAHPLTHRDVDRSSFVMPTASPWW